jgi:hypothetical protein
VPLRYAREVLPSRGDLRAIGACLALVVLCAGLAATGVGFEDAAMFAPTLVLLLPLLGGWYVGEEHLHELAARRRREVAPGRRASAAVAVPRSRARLMVRGGRLVASAMAKRPPPRPALSSIA